ncbi:MAG: Type II homoserine kinase [uncultured Sulfurovum sp.]|uniref:Type II homoserine kinase n=1 Tax=uncultured Sulfurovum sp. TaxID=269237 RepID=A0A6S6TAV5_9BACT|nr:MAG: Type II homoserine kinase [uncultured Sulfurovum sp.]
MGVRTTITLDEVNSLLSSCNISFERLEATSDGISDTTYVLYDRKDKKYLFKIYESANREILENEIELLNSLLALPTPKYLLASKNINTYKGKTIGLFSYLEGASLTREPSLNQISQIGHFLGNFHKQTENKKSINKNIFTNEALKQMFQSVQEFDCDGSIKEKFERCYELVKDTHLAEDGVIHGDLFLDNTKFVDEKLTAVFDFIESCNGSFLFDLSVVVNGWCFDNNYLFKKTHLEALLDAYNKSFGREVHVAELKEAMLFASLFYALQRFITKYIERRNVAVKGYEEYLIKFDVILGEI